MLVSQRTLRNATALTALFFSLPSLAQSRPPDRNPIEPIDWGGDEFELIIDTSTKTLSFTGSDSTTLDPAFSLGGPSSGFEGTNIWLLGDDTGVVDQVDIDLGFEGDNGSVIRDSDRNNLLVYANNGVALLLNLGDPADALAEYSGTGVAISYAGLDAPSQAYLGTLDGEVLAAGTGLNSTGYAPIDIRVVPEPASLALLVLGGVALLGRRRRA